MVLHPADERTSGQSRPNSKLLPGFSVAFFAGAHFAQSAVVQIRSLPLVTSRAKFVDARFSTQLTLPVFVMTSLNGCFASCLTFWYPARDNVVVVPSQATGPVAVTGWPEACLQVTTAGATDAGSGTAATGAAKVGKEERRGCQHASDNAAHPVRVPARSRPGEQRTQRSRLSRCLSSGPHHAGTPVGSVRLTQPRNRSRHGVRWSPPAVVPGYE